MTSTAPAPPVQLRSLAENGVICQSHLATVHMNCAHLEIPTALFFLDSNDTGAGGTPEGDVGAFDAPDGTPDAGVSAPVGQGSRPAGAFPAACTAPAAGPALAPAPVLAVEHWHAMSVTGGSRRLAMTGRHHLHAYACIAATMHAGMDAMPCSVVLLQAASREPWHCKSQEAALPLPHPHLECGGAFPRGASLAAPAPRCH